MVSHQPHGLTGLTDLFGLLLLSLEASIEEVHSAGDQPGDSGSDAGNGDLDVIQVTVLVRSGQVVRTEGAEQQGQEKIQHLQTNSRCSELTVELHKYKYEVEKQTKTKTNQDIYFHYWLQSLI